MRGFLPIVSFLHLLPDFLYKAYNLFTIALLRRGNPVGLKMKEPKTTLLHPELLAFFLKQRYKTKKYLFNFARHVEKLRHVEKKDKAVV